MSITVMTSLVAGTAVFALLHVGVWRAFPSNEPLMTLLGMLLAVSIGAAMALDYAFGQGGSLELCAVLWTGVSCGVFYVIFYSGLARSVSLTLLGRLFQAGPHPLLLDELVQEYATSDRFEDRVRLMHESGLVRLSGDSVELTKRGARVAHWSRGLGRIVGNRLEG